jgi:CII-binding regulator of phage lambda lysogenization HflD
MVSSGIRVGAWETLKVKHLTPVYSPQNPKVVIAGRLKVYDGLPNPYTTFVSPEAYQTVQEYLDFRRSYGEQITGESWLLRDKFQSSVDKTAARKSMASHPQKLGIPGIKKLLNRAMISAGLRATLPAGVHRQEYKLSHGFRKYYMSNAQRVMRPLNVELLMDHKTGVADSYWRPTEQDLLDDYCRAIEYLTVNREEKATSKLKNEIMDKLVEKERQIEQSKQEQQKLKEKLDSIYAMSVKHSKKWSLFLNTLTEAMKKDKKHSSEALLQAFRTINEL